ncbi:MFS transporter [Halobacillus kuroshimensis]|uniref:MFS transporter n=1 Tax=Halobacillus kuroshimensis TaxID=302481 RepID=UPI0003FCD5C8|nr:MFS transporter [Halobacillus kuroshimensis]
MKLQRLVLPGVTMIAICYGFARFSFGLLLPDITRDLIMSDSVTGLISSIFYIAYCCTIVLSIVFTTSNGPRLMILSAGLSAFIGLVFMAVSTNPVILSIGVFFAGASTGLVSPPFGAAISLWINEKDQGKANTWINSGTSFGISLSGMGALFLTSDWRLTYMLYAVLALGVFIWNFISIPKGTGTSDTILRKGKLSIKGQKGAAPLISASLMLGFASAAFWTFSRSFLEAAGGYDDWFLSGFWIFIGIMGVLGGFSAIVVEKRGVSFAYKLSGIALSASPVILVYFPSSWLGVYGSAGLFGSSYIFLTGVLLIWGIRVFVSNASLGIGVPFLTLALGQVMGSTLAGLSIEAWGYAITFTLYGGIGFLSFLISPGERKSSDYLEKWGWKIHADYQKE